MTHLAATLVAPLLAFASIAAAADRDPISLLRESAAAVEAAPSASVELLVTTKLVRDEDVSDLSSTLAYRSAPEGRFEFVTVDEKGEGGLPSFGYQVAGNGKVAMTALLGRKRHMLANDIDGLASFVRSPAAAGIGSGLGGVALAFLNTTAMEELIASLLDSEFVGEETVEGEDLLHARYTVQGDVPIDIWFLAGDTPLVRRIEPAVLQTPNVQSMAKRYKEFDYQLGFEFNNWNRDAGLTANDVAVAEPQGSLLMTSLYERPPSPPHSLLGQEAPAFKLPTAAGDELDLGEKFGEEVVLLEFWATNCPFCIKAMPELEKLEEEYAAKGLGYYAVNVGETPEDVAAFLEAQQLTPTALLDEEAEMASAYDVGPIPLILLIGRDGKVQSASEGFSPASRDKLAVQIESALEGEDLASVELAAFQAKQAERMAERKRLKSLLDG